MCANIEWKHLFEATNRFHIIRWLTDERCLLGSATDWKIDADSFHLLLFVNVLFVCLLPQEWCFHWKFAHVLCRLIKVSVLFNLLCVLIFSVYSLKLNVAWPHATREFFLSSSIHLPSLFASISPCSSYKNKVVFDISSGLNFHL